MQAVQTSSTVQSSGDMDMTMVYIYGNRRMLGPRRPNHKVSDQALVHPRSTIKIQKATLYLCRQMFPDIPTYSVISLHTKDLPVCRDQLTEIYDEIWPIYRMQRIQKYKAYYHIRTMVIAQRSSLQQNLLQYYQLSYVLMRSLGHSWLRNHRSVYDTEWKIGTTSDR